MQLGTFTAHIVVNGKVLEEYDVVSESPTKVTCWITSEEGKSFDVKWKCHEQPRITASQGMVAVDGIRCGGKWLAPGPLGVDDTNILSHFIGETMKRELMFARVQLTDDDSLLNKEIPKNLGQICLTIRRGKEVKKHRGTTKQKGSTVLGDNKFHERSKKATVHCIGFGPEMTRNCPSYRRRLIPNSDPTMTFVFKYQPFSVLQANGIAPRPTSNGASPSHEIGSSKRYGETFDDTTSEDIKPYQLDNRIQDLENELKRLRGLKPTNSEDQKPKRIKREEPGERRQPLFAPGEIIDLT